MSWGHAMMLRVYQSVGLAFLFVPINTVSYAGVQPEKNNQVSGLINLMRNVGGSVGISLSGAMIVERAQFHQHQLVQNVTAYDPQMHSMLHTLSRTLQLPASARRTRQIRLMSVFTRACRRRRKRSPTSIRSG